MQRVTVEGLYSVWVEEIAKVDIPWRDVDEVTAALQTCIGRFAATAFIGVADMGNRRVISFLDAPTVSPTEAMTQWIEDLRTVDTSHAGKVARQRSSSLIASK